MKRSLTKPYMLLLAGLAAAVCMLVFGGAVISPKVHAAASDFDGGNGTAESPYEIRTEAQLNNIRKEPYANYILVRNISLTAEWTPIPEFHGILDGDGCTVRNLSVATFEKTVRQYGMLRVNAGTVKNLYLEMSMNLNADAGVLQAGAVAGKNTGSIVNCTVRNTIAGTGIVLGGVSDETGGIAGRNEGLISDCQADVGITVNGGYTGGIVGVNFAGIVRESVYSGTVSFYLPHAQNAQSSVMYLGGIAAFNWATGGQWGEMTAFVTNNVFRGALSNRFSDAGTAHVYVGGILGAYHTAKAAHTGNVFSGKLPAGMTGKYVVISEDYADRYA